MGFAVGIGWVAIGGRGGMVCIVARAVVRRQTAGPRLLVGALRREADLELN
jgi:hypothetical protein